MFVLRLIGRFVLRLVGRIAVGILAVLGGISLLAIIAAFVVWLYLPKVEHALPDNAVLVVNLADGITEALPDSPFARASIGNVIVMRDLVQGLEAARGDDRVKGVVVRLGSGDLGMAQAQEIRDAVAGFRRGGKFALAFAESFGEAGDGDRHYYLAAAFDQVWLQPSGEVQLTGVLLEAPFVKKLLDDLGIAPRLDRRQEFKGAADTFTSERMPAPVRENLQRLADSWLEQMAEGIAGGRRMDAEQARGLIDRGPFLAEEAAELGLVDRLGYWDDVTSEVRTRAGDDAKLVAFGSYAAGLSPPSDAAKIAIVYGLGPVQLSASEEKSLFDSHAMASEIVAGALRSAIEDREVKAIIFRIDSPGGSYVGADTIWREVDHARRAGKPLIVSMGDTAASGGYFVAAPSRSIVAEPGTITGSIGVFGGKFVLSGLWKEIGIGWDGVTAGANADIMSFNHDYSPAGWAYLQRSLDRIYGDFTSKVAAGRRLPPDKVQEVAKGQVWSGADARARGLVDELGGLGTALRLARTAVGLDPAAPVRLEQFPPPRNELEELLGRFLGSAFVEAGGADLVLALGRLSQALAPVARLLEPLTAGSENQRLRLPEIESVR